MTNAKMELEEMLLNPDTIIQLANTLKSEQQQRQSLQQQNAELQQKINNRYVKADESNDSQCFSEIALQCNLPPREFTQKLVDENYLYRKNGKLLPNPNRVDEGLFEIKAWASQTVLTEKGQKFFKKQLKQNSLPTVPKVESKIITIQNHKFRILEFEQKIYLVAKDIAERYNYENTLEMLTSNKVPSIEVLTNTIEDTKKFKQYSIITGYDALKIIEKGGRAGTAFAEYLCFLMLKHYFHCRDKKEKKWYNHSFEEWLRLTTIVFTNEEWHFSHYGKQQIRWRKYDGEFWVILKDVALALKLNGKDPVNRAKWILKKNTLYNVAELKKFAIPSTPTKAVAIKPSDIGRLDPSQIPLNELRNFCTWLWEEIRAYEIKL